MDKDNFLGFIITDSNRFVVSAIAEKVSAIATEDYLQQREQQADKQAFQRLSAKISTVG
ncbi:MAG: hypothetical protein Q7T96_02720 [Methylobacter sp.]|nr:hypothetical protein [Methylobacter sp.]